MENILPYIHIILSVFLIAAILIQQSDASIGGIFGGSDDGEGVARTRRGAEKIIFQATIVLAILFTLSSIVSFLL